MSIIGNILWFLLGGFISGLLWIISGLLLCITIIGIPIGLQCFKFAQLAFFPFGKEIVYEAKPISLLADILWIIFFGVPMCLMNIFSGVICCITIIGIPFGLQFFKLARLSLMPFGAIII